MTHENMRLILKVLMLLSRMPSGNGWAIQVQITRWSGLSRSTVSRYMEGLLKLQLIESGLETLGKYHSYRFRITDAGLQWLADNGPF